MKKRILALLLSLITVFSFTACQNAAVDSTAGGNTGTPSNTVTENDPHYVEGTLHDVNVTESNRPFITNGKTDYSIVYSGGSLALQAAQYISKQINAATGAEISISETSGVQWSDGKKLIVINDTALFNAAGLTMPKEELGLNGYYIKTAGNSAFLMTKDETGCQFAALSFLKHTIGYEMLASDMIVYDKDGATMPNMEIIEKPDYDFIAAPWSVAKSMDSVYGMGFMSTGLSLFMNGVHNIFDILSPKDWGANGTKGQHAGWFSDDGTQWCYTAHGNKDELKLMQEECVKVLKQTILNNPDKRLLTVTQRDYRTECTCSTCDDIRQKYGSVSASIIQFLNPVEEAIQEWLEEIKEPGQEKRDVTILFFAYHKSEAAPAYKNEEGEWAPIDETVRCNDKLAVFLAPIDAYYNVPFYDEKNQVYSDRAEAWSACAKNIFMWTYQTGFNYYLYPYATWDATVQNYRYFKNIGAIGMFNQDQVNQGTASTHFTEFKYYLAAKAMFDVNVDYNELMDRFFSVYYGVAEQPMREMFDQLRAYMKYLNTEQVKLVGGIRDEIESAEFWPKGLLDSWLALIDEAYAKIEIYKTSDPMYYAQLERHIKMESIFPRYALIRLHSASYSPETLKEMQIAFRDDCRALTIVVYAENDSELESLYSAWGIES